MGHENGGWMNDDQRSYSKHLSQEALKTYGCKDCGEVGWELTCSNCGSKNIISLALEAAAEIEANNPITAGKPEISGNDIADEIEADNERLAADNKGQVHFARAMMESVADEIRAFLQAAKPWPQGFAGVSPVDRPTVPDEVAEHVRLTPQEIEQLRKRLSEAKP